MHTRKHACVRTCVMAMKGTLITPAILVVAARLTPPGGDFVFRALSFGGPGKIPFGFNRGVRPQISEEATDESWFPAFPRERQSHELGGLQAAERICARAGFQPIAAVSAGISQHTAEASRLKNSLAPRDVDGREPSYGNEWTAARKRILNEPADMLLRKRSFRAQASGAKIKGRP